MITLYEFEKLNELMIAAHRGSSGTITENTLAAFDDAVKSGVNTIELDVQITSDNQLVVFHDFYPPGFDKRISELKYEEIKNLEFGNDIGEEFDSVHIPLLKDVINLVKGKCYLMIELKVNSGIKFLENAEKVIDLILDNNYQLNTIFGSFSYSTLKAIKKINPDIYTAALKVSGDNRLPSDIQSDIGCDAYICSIDELNEEIEVDATNHHIFTGVYTVDDENSLNKALQYKVRAIATNYPVKIIDLLNKRSKANNK